LNSSRAAAIILHLIFKNKFSLHALFYISNAIFAVRFADLLGLKLQFVLDLSRKKP